MTETKNKKIVLATAPFDFMEVWYAPPLGLAYIASCLEKEGYSVEIIDSHLRKFNIKKAAKTIVRNNPDAVGLSAMTDNRFNVIELSKEIKRLEPNIFIFVGGPHFTTTAEDAIGNIPTIDVVVIGEGECSSVELLNCYFSGKSLYHVKNICYKDKRANEKIVQTETQPAVKNLDLLPMPAYHLLELNKYSPLGYYLTNLTPEEKRMPAASVISSRGCPNSCIFCANNSDSMKTKFRTRNPQLFVDEIQYLYEKYGFRMFNFWDDTFTLSKEFVLMVCEEIITRSLRIKWYARGRVNTVSREILQYMKDAGCIAILFGAESGSEKILKILKKNITVEQVKRSIQDAADVGMDVLVAFMISFPGETNEDIEKTLKLIKELRSYSNKIFETDLSPTVIYPGTVIEKIALDEGRIFPKDFSWNKKIEFKENKLLLMNSFTPIYTQQFTLEEIMAFRLKNKFQQQLKQSKFKILSKGIRFIMSIRSFSDLKTLLSIFKQLKLKIK